ncbi:MAG: CHAT domain-containing protein, partial [Acidobacteriota bacterium]|nr:CHAT domain-containing protein [Acidobacteriota bacterium]
MNGQGDYCWVRVRILGLRDADGYYRVEVEMDDGRWFQHKMKLGDAEESALVAITPGDTQAYGINLYQLLFSNSDNPDEPSLREALQNAWGRASASQDGQLRVQLWISEECSELHRFRWERMFMPLDNQWRALANFSQTPFSRFTRLPLRDPEPGTGDRPLKVLMALSNPKDLTDLPGELAEVEVEQEIKNFYEAVKDFPEVFVTFAPGRTGIKDEGLLAALVPPRFRVLKNESTTIKLIQRELANHHILHFTGHGTFEKGKRKPASDSAAAPDPKDVKDSSSPALEKPSAPNKRATWLVLEDEVGNAEKIEDASIVHNLIQRGDNQLPRLIFLSSCDTSRYDERNPRAFNSLGPRLVEAGFPAVVAMQDKVPVETASELTRNFYGNLLEEGVIDSALNRSRWFLYDKVKLLDNWTIPVLFMRTPRGQLFTADPKRLALRAISEAKQFGPSWDYDYLPLEAVVLVRNQISANWENTVMLTRARVDLHEQLERLLNKSGKPSKLNASDKANEQEALVIALTGERGTARSTTARAIVRVTAEQSLALSGDSPQRPILPVYVDLGEVIVASSKVPSYLNLLVESLKSFWPDSMDEAMMVKLLEAEQFRIIFDNGDDLSPSQRNQLLEEIGKLTRDFPRHQYLLTMGRGMWRLEQDRVSTPKVKITHLLDVQPISRYRIEKFLDECVEFDRQAALNKAPADSAKPAATNATTATTATAVTTVTLDNADTSVTAVTTVTVGATATPGTAGTVVTTDTAKAGKSAIGELRLQLERTQLFDMASMPWMLVMMVRQAQAGDLPKSRVGVLRDLIEDKVSWITQWRGQQPRALDTLYELAYQMQRQNLPSLPIKDALTIIARVRDNREYALEEMLDSLIEQDLLARAGGDAVRFLYSQYQAYCCAQYLCRQKNSKLWEEITAGLGRITHLRRWNDTLTLLCGLLEEPQGLLETIAYATSLKDGEQVFLAARCLLEARQAGSFAIPAVAQAKDGNGAKAQPSGLAISDNPASTGSYVESLVLDALLWRSDSTN